MEVPVPNTLKHRSVGLGEGGHDELCEDFFNGLCRIAVVSLVRSFRDILEGSA
jgi:hypothetical protein